MNNVIKEILTNVNLRDFTSMSFLFGKDMQAGSPWSGEE